MSQLRCRRRRRRRSTVTVGMVYVVLCRGASFGRIVWASSAVASSIDRSHFPDLPVDIQISATTPHCCASLAMVCWCLLTCLYTTTDAHYTPPYSATCPAPRAIMAASFDAHSLENRRAIELYGSDFFRDSFRVLKKNRYCTLYYIVYLEHINRHSDLFTNNHLHRCNFFYFDERKRERTFSVDTIIFHVCRLDQNCLQSIKTDCKCNKKVSILVFCVFSV
jgi:hypothetical protein